MKRTMKADGQRLRVLVAIASFGEKNLHFLKRLIEVYRGMAMDVDVVVHSNAPKDLGPGVTVVVGLPSRNPWSLPFAHKALFAQRAGDYDLFVYTEDDMGVSEASLRAFLEVAPALNADEVAGYLRYEVDEKGDWSLPDMHGPFHWKPNSVRRRGRHIVAEFTNEHAGFYVLTRDQLKRAIASGGFLREPYEGQYGMLETAATDPYTACGFRKVICVSALEDFLIHHLPNRYVKQLGIPLAAAKEQVDTLTQILEGRHPATVLCEADSRLSRARYSKSYYESSQPELMRLIPAGAKSVLSVGCGWGLPEGELVGRGCAVTAIPLDSVIGASAARRGIETVYGDRQECFRRLESRTFDSVVVTNLLHLQEDPAGFLEDCCRLVGKGGALVIGGPNFTRLRSLIKRALDLRQRNRLKPFAYGGVNPCGPDSLTPAIEKAGLTVGVVKWLNPAAEGGAGKMLPERFGCLTAMDWILQAKR
jgi:SAM-dependent methyltransferase